MRQLPLHDLSFVDGATIVARVTREVAATPDEVFADLADAPSWPSWVSFLTGARWVSEEPHGVGSIREVDLGPLTFREQFIAWDEGERLAFALVGAEGPGSQTVRGGVEVAELRPGTVGRTMVTYTMAVDAPGPRSLLQPIAAPGTRAVWSHALGRLEKRIEERR